MNFSPSSPTSGVRASRSAVLWASCLLAACAPTLAPDDDDAGARDAGLRGDASVPRASGSFTHEVGADGVIESVVDASDADAWQHLDLDSGESVGPAGGWDLAFSRFRVRTNGGVSGAGGVQVAVVDAGSFEDLAMAPERGWTVDVADGEDDDTEADNAFNNGSDDWYAYDVETHTLTARDRLYAVASTDGRFYVLQLLGYYDGAGSPGFVRFRWREIDPASSLPDSGVVPTDAGVRDDGGGPVIPPGALTVSAIDTTAWVYVSVEDGVVVPSDPAADLGWDLAFRRTEVRTNGGTSGAGVGGAREDDTGAAFDAVDHATTFGYALDEVLDSGAPGAVPASVSPTLGGWYDYDPTTHTVAPGDRVYLVRTATGSYAKLRIWSWIDGTYALSLAPVARRVEVRELDVDASSADAWTYLSLRDGAIVTPGDASSDAGWDVGLSRTRMRTNGGTSGEGVGAAVETSASAISGLGTPPSEGYTEDMMISDGAPGSPEVSANPVLGGWYDYDPATHVVSPRATVFAVRTADGELGALRVLTWASGAMRVEVAFAGAGRGDFGAGGTL